MVSMLYVLIALAVFVHWTWTELKRDLFGDKQFYSLKELEEMDRAKQRKMKGG